MVNTGDIKPHGHLGPYLIASSLGAGGMGEVFKARDTRLNRAVAIKLMPPVLASDPTAKARFAREAQAIAALNHPNICTLHDIGEHAGQQFMVKELLDGESLADRLSRGPLAVADVVDVALQIVDALDAAHAAGVVHRDIKPANLFVTARGRVKVLDFGIAKLAESRQAPATFATTVDRRDITTSGSSMGTMAYMSPEQARGQHLDQRSDLFSFGIVLYEMATGGHPFSGQTPAVIFEAILGKQPPAPSTVRGDVPVQLDRIVLKALEKDLATRYTSASDLRADLRSLQRDEGRHIPASTNKSSEAILPAAPLVSGRRRRAFLIGAPLVTVGAVAIALFLQSERAPALTARDTVVLADAASAV